MEIWLNKYYVKCIWYNGKNTWIWESRCFLFVVLAVGSPLQCLGEIKLSETSKIHEIIKMTIVYVKDICHERETWAESETCMLPYTDFCFNEKHDSSKLLLAKAQRLLKVQPEVLPFRIQYPLGLWYHSIKGLQVSIWRTLSD